MYVCMYVCLHFILDQHEPKYHSVNNFFFYYYLVCEDIGTAATPGLLCQPRVIMKMIVEKQMECRLAGETEVVGENLTQRHICPSQNPTWPDPVLNPGRRGGKPATNRLSYGAAQWTTLKFSLQNVIEIHWMLSEVKLVDGAGRYTNPPHYAFILELRRWWTFNLYLGIRSVFMWKNYRPHAWII
jgi:hypothetical protein